MTGSRVAAGCVAATAVLVVIDVLLAWANGWPVVDGWLFSTVATVAFGVLGGVVTLKRPDNRLGWLLLVTTLLSALGAVAFQYGILGTLRRPGLPGATVVGGVGWGVSAALMFGVLVTLFLLLFPDGHLPSSRWRPAAWAAVLGTALMIGGLAAGAVDAGMPTVVARAATRGGFTSDGLPRVLNEVGHVLVFAVCPLAVASLFVRLRRADPVERRQVEWFAYGVVLFVASLLLPAPEPVSLLFEATATILLPVSIAVAITRYRLYEIDRLLSRTVTYAVVSAVLVGIYGAITVVPSAALDLRSDLLVAAATLAAAAVFVPVRVRVQTAVDRRFNRARYDAALVVEQFAARLRHDVDLRVLAHELGDTVASTMQPAHVSLWLAGRQSIRDRPAP